MITDRNLNLGFTTIDLINEIKLKPKQISYQIIHNHSPPIQLQVLALYRPTQLEFPHHNWCGTKTKKQIKRQK